MGILEAIILGLVQGLTEFLPISSSGHVFVTSELLKIKDPGAGFTAVIQIGTLLAVFIYFWKDIVRIFTGWLKGLTDKEARASIDSKLGWGILAGTIPIVILGLFFEDQIDSTLRSPWVVIGALTFFGLLMGVAEMVGKRERTIEEFTVKDGVLMGLWQCLALIPGSSRSGCTITGGLFGKFDRTTSARVSFLLSVPSVLGSGVYKLLKEKDTLLGAGVSTTVVATVVSFVSGYLAIAFLMKFLQTRSTWVFVIYRVILAAVLAGMILTGFLASS